MKIFALTLLLSIFMQGAPVFATTPNYALPILDTEGDAICSAALLSPTVVITAAHCIEDVNKFAFLKCGKNLSIGRTVKLDQYFDLAIIKLAEACDSIAPVTLATADPEEGTSLLVQGFPAMGPRKTTSGVVTGYDFMVFESRSWRPRLVMLTDATIIGGNSGGPVMANGTLIGIVNAKICYDTPRRMVPGCYGILSPPSAIRAFLLSKD